MPAGELEFLLAKMPLEWLECVVPPVPLAADLDAARLSCSQRAESTLRSWIIACAGSVLGVLGEDGRLGYSPMSGSGTL